MVEESKMGRCEADMSRAIYITRCNIGWYSKNANAFRKPLEVASKYETALVVSDHCSVPKEIAEKCAEVVRFCGLKELLMPRNALNVRNGDLIFTGFDFPCMFKAWRLKKRFGCKWTVYLWDPPSLSRRDGFPPLRWTIDAVFRFFAKRCDTLVLNIHPGLLDEIGYKPRDGQVEVRMQDAFEGVDLDLGRKAVENVACEYDFGVLANWGHGKGGPLMVAAMKRMPNAKCLWIGNPPSGDMCGQITFAGRKSQDEAFGMLKRCRVLVVPYLATHALKWNYPLKLFEYLQIGRPILASDNPGNGAIAERYAGRIVLFMSGNVDDLVLKATELLVKRNAD